MIEKPGCPVCGSPDPVHKVSQIYVAGITLPKQRTATDRATLLAVFGREPVSTIEIQMVSRQFAPPQGGTSVLRPVHPDLIVAIFSMMALVFLFNTFGVSLSMFWIILSLWLVFLGGYGLTRKRLVARHQATMDLAKGDRDQVKAGMARWMKVYYCCADDVIFDPDRGDSAPLNALQRYLRQPQPA